MLAAPWGGNIGLRMPADVIGLDVDAYHGGKDTLLELIARLGHLPPTWISHSGREDGSGIYLFRVPPWLSWVSGLAGVEIIQRNHRYAVVWPSLHPEGRSYGWYDMTELFEPAELPLVEELPELPWSWIAELSRAQTGDLLSSVTPVGSDELHDFLDANVGADQPAYIATIVADFEHKRVAGFSATTPCSTA